MNTQEAEKWLEDNGFSNACIRLDEYHRPELYVSDVLIKYAQQQGSAVSHSCICCGKEIKKLDGLPKDKDWEGMWNGGIVGRISAGYGSLLDGDMYVLAICDDCVKLKELKYVGNVPCVSVRWGF